MADSGSANSCTGLPDWVCGLKNLPGSEVNGVGLTEDPIGFVTMVVLDLIVGGFLDLAGSIASQIITVLTQIRDAILDAGWALSQPFEIVAGLILGMLEAWHMTLLDLAVAAGPFSPFVVVAGWAVTAWIVAVTARALLEVVKWI